MDGQFDDAPEDVTSSFHQAEKGKEAIEVSYRYMYVF